MPECQRVESALNQAARELGIRECTTGDIEARTSGVQDISSRMPRCRSITVRASLSVVTRSSPTNARIESCSALLGTSPIRSQVFNA